MAARRSGSRSAARTRTSAGSHGRTPAATPARSSARGPEPAPAFESGRRAKSWTPAPEEYLIKLIDADEGARRLGELGIGTNYGIDRGTRDVLLDEKIGGTVHMAVGASYPEGEALMGFERKPTVAAAPALVAMVACLGLAAPAAADTFKPTRFDDPAPGKCKPSDCSLREAFLAANALDGHDAIRLDRGRYRIQLPPDEGLGEDGMWWAYDVSIRGKGPGATTLDGNEVDSVMQLGNFNESNRLQGVQVTGGSSSEPGAVGGIYATGTNVTVKDVVFADNHTTAGSGGGAVLAPRVKLKLIDSKVVKNSAVRGGGLFVGPGSAGITKATIRDSTIRKNGSSLGGGVYSNVLELTVLRTTIAGNESNEGGGFVLASYFNNLSNPPPSTAILSSTISGNTAIKGGGILADGNQPMAGGLLQVVTVQNSTVANNMASADGGGIMADNGVTMTIDNATVAYNQANSDNVDLGLGGGVYQHSGASFTLEDSVIAANTLGQGGNGQQCAGAFTGSGGLVIQFQMGTACSVSGSIAEPNDALIAPLADNGGPTKTVKLLSGSDAIAIAQTCPPTDQRGKPRPEEDCDAGAFERKGL